MISSRLITAQGGVQASNIGSESVVPRQQASYIFRAVQRFRGVQLRQDGYGWGRAVRQVENGRDGCLTATAATEDD